MSEQENKSSIVASAYIKLHDSLVVYIANRTGDRSAAEDICQDVFLRALEYELITPETINSFVYTIARHLIVDRLRRRACQMAARTYIKSHYVTQSNTTFHEVSGRDLERVEKLHVSHLSTMRGKVYTLSRYDGMTTAEIATALDISPRTAETHLFAARKEVRQRMKECIS